MGDLNGWIGDTGRASIIFSFRIPGRERSLEVYKVEKRKVKRCIYQSKKEVQGEFGRKMNQDVNGNRKLFWMEVSKNERKVENSNRIKDGNGRLILEEAEL